MSLKDELLKANLISKKRLKQIAHEQRVEKKKLGQDGVKEKQRKRQQELNQKRKARQEQDKQRAQEKKQEQLRKQRMAQIHDIVEHGKITEGMHGHRKFYFVAQSGKIPFLMIGEDLAEKLGKGLVSIVEHPVDEFCVVAKKVSEKLKTLDENVVRF